MKDSLATSGISRRSFLGLGATAAVVAGAGLA
ncbi:MAG: twin-arginine translocation signal domain-containing protein, partial [Raoultibacter sp.]